MTSDATFPVACEICGVGIKSEAEVGQVIDAAVGQVWCTGCGGDARATSLRKRMGWAWCTFIDARIGVLAERLSDAQRERFIRMTYAQKANMVIKLVQGGSMI